MKTSHICIGCKYEINDPVHRSYLPASMDKLTEFDDLKIISCPNCGFSFPTKKISEEDLSYYYSSYYGGRAKKVVKNIRKLNFPKSWINIRSLSQIELIRKFINLDKNTNVLDIGSGPGDFFRTLKFLGYRTNNYAIEPQIDAHPNLEFLGVEIVKDTLNTKVLTKMPDGKYDLIIMSHSLEHFNAIDIPDILGGIYNALSDGGIFLCEVPNANLEQYPNAGERVVPHLAFFSTESIKHFINKAGFKIKFLDTCGENQLEKKPFSDQDQKTLTEKGFYTFKTSNDGKLKINVGYHNWLNKKNRREKRYYFILKVLERIPLFKSFREIIQKFKSLYNYDILNDNNFVYSNNREYIRVVSNK